MPGDLADKVLLLQDLMFIASVRDIDGVPRMPLTEMASYEAVGDVLGDAGMGAGLAFVWPRRCSSLSTLGAWLELAAGFGRCREDRLP